MKGKERQMIMEPWPVVSPERYRDGLDWLVQRVAEAIAKREAAEHARAVETWEVEGGR